MTAILPESSITLTTDVVRGDGQKTAVRGRTHIAALDGIRGIAILMVIVHHLAASLNSEYGFHGPIVWLADMGWIGVDLFFVLSGFLITGILYDAKESNHFLRNFYMRRVLRIFPLYYGVLAAVTLFLILRNNGHPSMITGHGEMTWGLWAYATNILIAIKGWGFYGGLDHFWSLAIEEHFYLVWPFVVLWLSRGALMKVAVACWIGALALRSVMALSGVDPTAIYVLTPCRIDSLTLGAFLALAIRRDGGIESLLPWAKRIGLVALGALVALIAWRDGLSNRDPIVLTIGLSLLGAASGAALVIATAASKQALVGRCLTTPSLRFFGKYSYGLYVLHPPLFMLILHSNAVKNALAPAGAWQPLVASLLALAVMMGLTLLSWHLYEKQFLKLKRLYE